MFTYVLYQVLFLLCALGTPLANYNAAFPEKERWTSSYM